jgi:ribulose 1,5-bisphosphate synthetase/thiazole synthase
VKKFECHFCMTSISTSSNKSRYSAFMLEIQNVPQTWDVIVVGGGTTGAIAGIAAARAGAKTLVVEALGSLGGSGTNAQVTPLMRNVSSGDAVGSI